MSVEDVFEARNDLYGIFDRGIEVQQFGTAKTHKEDAEEVSKDLALDGYLEETTQRNPSITPKLKRVFALVETIGELSGEIKPNDHIFMKTYFELRRRYFDNKPIPDDLLKDTEFLNAFRKKLNRYQR